MVKLKNIKSGALIEVTNDEFKKLEEKGKINRIFTVETVAPSKKVAEVVAENSSKATPEEVDEKKPKKPKNNKTQDK